jgi:hypothetical protein
MTSILLQSDYLTLPEVNSGVHDSVFRFSRPLIFFLARALLTLILSTKVQNPAPNFMPAAVLQFLARTKGASCEKLS